MNMLATVPTSNTLKKVSKLPYLSIKTAKMKLLKHPLEIIIAMAFVLAQDSVKPNGHRISGRVIITIEITPIPQLIGAQISQNFKLKKHDFKPCQYGRTASKLEGLAGDFGTPGFLMKMVTSKVPINPHPV